MREVIVATRSRVESVDAMKLMMLHNHTVWMDFLQRYEAFYSANALQVDRKLLDFPTIFIFNIGKIHVRIISNYKKNSSQSYRINIVLYMHEAITVIH